MQDLNVTLVQADQRWEDKQANFLNYTRLLEGVETDFIVLPEMFHTGFTMNVATMAEDMENSIGTAWLKNLSREKNAAVYTSLIIREGDKVYNRGIFVEPSGKVMHYDKRKSFGLAGEDRFFTPGQAETIVEYRDWKIQLQICYDLRFPEIVRNRINSNQKPAYDVIVYVANWPEKRSLHWNTLLTARAIENQCFVIGVNRVGKDANDLVYCGDSQLVNAQGIGQILEKNQEMVVTTVMKSNDLQKTRELLPFLKDR